MAAQIETIVTQRANLALVISNLQEAVLALDRQGHIMLANSAAEKLFASQDQQVIGQNIQSVVRISEILDFLEELQPNQTLTRQIEIDSKDPKRTLELQAADVSGKSEQGICTLLVARDVTEQVRSAAVKAEFAANASHELRTPLATIRAAVDSLGVLQPGQDEELSRIVTILDRHTKRLEEMTNDLLDLHRLEQAQLQIQANQINLGNLAGWIRSSFGAQADKQKVRLTVEGDYNARFRSDLSLIQLILKNLVDNAVKFTPPGGSVHCDLQADHENILFTVTDTGCGIPPEIQERVFERFFQADPSRSGLDRTRGSGLGLAIVKHAASRLQAKIDLQSEPGRGTSVRLILPRTVVG